MGSVVLEYPWTSPTSEYLPISFETSKMEESLQFNSIMPEKPISSPQSKIPTPPPLPKFTISIRIYRKKSLEYCCTPKETIQLWDKLFKEGFGADVLVTGDKSTVPAHFCVLRMVSPFLEKYLEEYSKQKNGVRYVRIPGIPHGAISTFIRFLYSSCYEEEDMKKYVLHLLVLSHAFVIPRLKQVCINYLEKYWLNIENVIDVLQLARKCDAPRLSFVCIRMVVRNFKTVALTEAWKVMKRVNPELEQELLESVVEADSRKQEKARKIEEQKVYMQLNEAIEALLHIWKDGCSTIGPRDKLLKGNQVPCTFPACKGIEMLIRHFFSCKARVPGGCSHCKRMWKLLELHSRMCNMPDSCNVPICRHFKEKVRQQSKKDEAKWKLLVRKVMEAKNPPQNPFLARLSG